MMRRLVGAALLIGAGLFWYLLQDALSLDDLVTRERALRALIHEQPWQAFSIGFALYVVVSILPGTTGKAAVAAWFFGFWQGLLMVVGGLTIAGAIGFVAARCVFRDALRDVLGYRLTGFDRLLERDGGMYLLTLRLLHVPFTLVNYVSGVSIVRPWTFTWTTAVGLVPGSVMLVALGAGLPSLGALRDQGLMSLISPVLLAALLSMALVPWIVRWILRAVRSRRAVDESLDTGAPALGR